MIATRVVINTKTGEQRLEEFEFTPTETTEPEVIDKSIELANEISKAKTLEELKSALLGANGIAKVEGGRYTLK